MTDAKSALILFDGVCNFCSASVRFILARDRHAHFRFAALQSEAGKQVLQQHGFDTAGLDSIVLVSGDVLYTKSDAIMAIARELGGFWRSVASLAQILPRSCRDRMYDFFARHRTRWFGKRSSCALPPPAFRDRFLD